MRRGERERDMRGGEQGEGAGRGKRMERRPPREPRSMRKPPPPVALVVEERSNGLIRLAVSHCEGQNRFAGCARPPWPYLFPTAPGLLLDMNFGGVTPQRQTD